MDSNTPIRIFIVDDHHIITDSLVRIINEQNRDLGYNRYQYVGRATNGDMALERINGDKVDLVILDIQMPGKDGMETTALLKGRDPNLKVLIFTGFGRRSKLVEAMQKGANGFMSKNRGSQEIITAIDKIMAGDLVFDADVDEDEPVSQPPPSVPMQSQMEFTDIQKQIAPLIADGLSDEEIAQQLGLPTGAVEYQRRILSTKLGAKNHAHLVLILYKIFRN